MSSTYLPTHLVTFTLSFCSLITKARTSKRQKVIFWARLFGHFYRTITSITYLINCSIAYLLSNVAYIYVRTYTFPFTKQCCLHIRAYLYVSIYFTIGRTRLCPLCGYLSYLPTYLRRRRHLTDENFFLVGNDFCRAHHLHSAKWRRPLILPQPNNQIASNIWSRNLQIFCIRWLLFMTYYTSGFNLRRRLRTPNNCVAMFLHSSTPSFARYACPKCKSVLQSQTKNCEYVNRVFFWGKTQRLQISSQKLWMRNNKSATVNVWTNGMSQQNNHYSVWLQVQHSCCDSFVVYNPIVNEPKI